MVAPNILRNFQGDRALDALNAGIDFTEGEKNWPVSGRAQIYQESALAFGPTPDFKSFHLVYNWMVKDWKINSRAPKDRLASAEKTFEMLVDGCTSVGRHAGVTLLSIDDQAIRTAVRAMSGVKTNKEYPHMAASKFLHFYNPSLFPIYDEAVMWKRVLHGTFRSEWAAVCRQYGIKVWEPSEGFLLTYISWAGEVMRAADPKVMTGFERRFREIGGQNAATLGDTKEYYATAFEYVLIGAAVAQ